MQRIGGSRRKTRGKFSKKASEKGKISLRAYFQEYEPGERVFLTVEPAIQKGMYYPRFVGKSGIIKCKAGSCYEVEIKDFKKAKTLIVHPVHLRKIK
ncbi:MAG: 50S ribosomal protein L21e [Nanoarchaeota archaeon]|nr:50S ribosomal protein L21e [Nanoarchaeota archaeon]MBU1703860.1 50S ribosomal protein L21e [Nanoarchaeota archaeon]